MSKDDTIIGLITAHMMLTGLVGATAAGDVSSTTIAYMFLVVGAIACFSGLVMYNA